MIVKRKYYPLDNIPFLFSETDFSENVKIIDIEPSFNTMVSASFVIDLINHKLVKNRLGSPDNEVLYYFLNLYRADIDHSLKILESKLKD